MSLKTVIIIQNSGTKKKNNFIFSVCARTLYRQKRQDIYMLRLRGHTFGGLEIP